MIPEFDECGYLPPGVHTATLDEIEKRFGTGSEFREAQCESLRWLVETARRAGVQRILLNGSFVTDAAEPNDVDCVLLIDKEFPDDKVQSESYGKGCRSSTSNWPTHQRSAFTWIASMQQIARMFPRA